MMYPRKETLELYDIKIVVRSIFNKDNKYIPQVFLDDCL